MRDLIARLTAAALALSLVVLGPLPGHQQTAQAAVGPCNVLPANNVWNADISSLPVNSRSAAWLSATGATAGRKLHPDFGGPPYGIPYNVVTNAHATSNYNFQYWDESDPVVATQQPQGPYPSGNDLAIENGSDSHMLAVNTDTCTLYEIGGTNMSAHTGWAGAIFDLNSNALRPNTWTSADAAGLPILPGLVRLDEVQAGAINHAIRFTVQSSDKSYLWPARHQAGSAYNHNLPPMGARFRLKASYNISGFNAPTQVVLTAFKKYGVIVADNGSNWYFQGTEDAGWDNEPYATMISQLKTIPASAFEAVDESLLMMNANSGQAATICRTAGLTPANPVVPAGSTIYLTASSNGCPNPHYQFYIQYPNGTWYLKRAWGGPTWAWDTTGLAPGTYTIHSWSNDTPDQTTRYEVFGTSVVKLTGCTAATVTPSTGSSARGVPVTFTASSKTCPNPVYQFWIRDTVGKWHVMRSWSSSNTWTWNNAGWGKGSYRISVWVNQQGSYLGKPQTYAASNRTLT